LRECGMSAMKHSRNISVNTRVALVTEFGHLRYTSSASYSFSKEKVSD
jgi:hypothetical protein